MLARLSPFDSKTLISPYSTVPRWPRSARHGRGFFGVNPWPGLAGKTQAEPVPEQLNLRFGFRIPLQENDAAVDGLAQQHVVGVVEVLDHGNLVMVLSHPPSGRVVGIDQRGPFGRLRQRVVLCAPDPSSFP